MPRVPMKKIGSLRIGLWVLLVVVVMVGITLSLPIILISNIQHQEKYVLSVMNNKFPVTVNPKEKIIVENPLVNSFLESNNSPLAAAVGNTGAVLNAMITWIAVAISEASWYQGVAAVAVGGDRLVSITPGMRKEQVANAFAKALVWNAEQKRDFLNATSSTMLPDGTFAPGVYSVAPGTTPQMARTLIDDRFVADVLDRYGPETARIVPLNQALTIASLIEREAGGREDMRLISGIIWNRLFIDMKLQIDATLQYAKANTATAVTWWPPVVPADRFRKSPFNTYQHTGLPPAPIASPSVATILAALNPRSTSCFFYFHDAARQFHCSDTYTEHVALLKQYYGRGK